MLGLVMTLVAATAPAPAGPAVAVGMPGAGAGVECAEGPASCELAPVPPREPTEYATPAVIDCRSSVVPLVLSTLVGECTGMPLDASYRASRYPESEDSQSLSPATHERRGSLASCDGLPQKAPAPPLSDAQPLAVFAVPSIVLVAKDMRAPRADVFLPSRFGDPPDRPPRV
jgi:hypothetical protein